MCTIMWGPHRMEYNLYDLILEPATQLHIIKIIQTVHSFFICTVHTLWEISFRFSQIDSQTIECYGRIG